MPDWDFVAVLAAETEAHALLYWGPDADHMPFTTYSSPRGCSMLDADAHLGRRAWVACPSCGNGGCASCAAGKTCDLHWQYLLASQARLLFLQCLVCMFRWWHDPNAELAATTPITILVGACYLPRPCGLRTAA